ncbi:copper chaperone PCu(A)C [Alteromonas sp. 1_MG-2023]|uniref:copper chaperone PCu(A)C n=1 Tax=Alteromonas sp. 1_MG-2023 TaxID=3062669 RepID=UPI0026E486F1|nr:copper chaperone PCu(A)C [Alteromonas sp. 1_MG-2023]MDO6568950.1 copper chaperone PCu(A)C [Alteromonas sp. 1_MG-2023]
MTSHTPSLSFKLLALFMFALTACSVQANHPVAVSDGYARATFPMAKSAALYFTLSNESDKPVTLIGVTVSSDVANDAQIHTTEMKDDMMRMREVKEGVTVSPSESVSFAPGGYHVMLLGLEKGLSEGNAVALTLTFDDAPDLSISLPVKGLDKEAGHRHHH